MQRLSLTGMIDHVIHIRPLVRDDRLRSQQYFSMHLLLTKSYIADCRLHGEHLLPLSTKVPLIMLVYSRYASIDFLHSGGLRYKELDIVGIDEDDAEHGTSVLRIPSTYP